MRLEKRLKELEAETPRKVIGKNLNDFYELLKDPKYKAWFDAWYDPNRKTSLSRLND